MPGDSVQAAVSLTAFHGPLAVASPRPANVRSRATNQPQRMAIDGRTELGRRVRDLAESFAQQLGGWPALSDMQVAAVRRAAELGALAEQSKRDALRGGHVDPLALSRLEGVAARAQRALCIENRRKPAGPDLRAQFRAAYGLHSGEEVETEAATSKIAPPRQVEETAFRPPDGTDVANCDGTALSSHALDGEDVDP
jgi:hypothetical protein